MHVDPNSGADSGGSAAAAGHGPKWRFCFYWRGLFGAGAYRLFVLTRRATRAFAGCGQGGAFSDPLRRDGHAAEGSPLRRELKIEPIVAKDIKRDLVLPAVVGPTRHG